MDQKFATIQAAITSMVTIKRNKKTTGYTARIKCPYCKGSISVFHSLNGRKGIGTWNSSNFGRHLDDVHMKNSKKEKSKKRVKKSVDDSLGSDNDVDIATEPNHSLDIKSSESLRSKINENAIKNATSTLDSVAIGPDMIDVPTTASKTVFSGIVNYSDTDGSSDDDKDTILVEVPSNLDPVMMELIANKGKSFKQGFVK